MKKINDSNKLAIQMLIAMVSGILVGLIFMAVRQFFGADSKVWTLLNNILFQDITAKGAESAIGLFYIGGQLFIRALQLIIVPMVFCSVVMAISEISEASTLGRVSAKTIGWFMMTSTVALVVAGTIALCFYKVQLHVIQELFLHVTLGNQTGLFDNTVGQGRFTVVNVCNNAEISYILLIVHRLPLVKYIASNTQKMGILF